MYLLPTFGQKDVTSTTREEVKTLACGMLAKGKSRSTVNNVLARGKEKRFEKVGGSPTLGVY